MISFPNAKINIGLNVVSKREDGYHNIESIFYPIKLSDGLDMVRSDKTELTSSGIKLEGDNKENLVLKAYYLFQKEFDLPPVKFHLHKSVPFGAGLGGGSSDAAFVLKMLNEFFTLELTEHELEKYAARIGADCAFFIKNRPAFASGIGNVLEEIKLDISEYKIIIIKPDVSVSTPEAYKKVNPAKPAFCLKNIGSISVDDWKNSIVNDFEESVFFQFPELKKLKETLYQNGAVYAAMSGSGSALFGLFRHSPIKLDNYLPKGIFIYR